MSFIHLSLLPFVIVFFFLFAFFYIGREKFFYKWVEQHWFFKRSLSSLIASTIFLGAVFFMCLSFLDLRGPETRIKATVPQQRTIVIIDSSASMLAEDVRPNRFSKAIIMARHFVKKAAGHQISVLLFSDLEKRVVPFTDDVDLLDARISALRNMDLRRGGSNLSASILEAIQYFKTSRKDDEVYGNVLIFTDAEENESGIRVDVPSGVSVALVGIGTRKGAPIPIRSRNGSFQGYKKFDGKEVLTKLDEKFIQSLEKRIKSYKYWIAHSYTMPTEEILEFFGSVHKKKFSQNDIVIRPVYGHYLVLVAVILFSLSGVLKLFPTFKASSLIVFFLLLSFSTYAQEGKVEDKDEMHLSKVEFLQEELQEKLKTGNLELEKKLKLAETFLKTKEHEKALNLYLEITKNTTPDVTTVFNLGTAYLLSKKIKKAVLEYNKLLRDKRLMEVDKDGKIRNSIRNNMLLALSSQGQKNQKGKQDQQDKQKDDKKGEQKNEQGQGQDQKDQEQGEGEKKDQSKDENSKDGENKQQDQKSSKGDERDNKQKEADKNQGNDKEESDQKPDDSDKDNADKGESREEEQSNESEGEEAEQKKVPAILKQIENDDRKLQSKFLDTKTSDKKKRDKKDW